MRTDLSPSEFTRKIIETAEYFGFRSIETLAKNPICKACDTNLAYLNKDTNKKSRLTEEIMMQGLEAYCTEKIFAINTPVLFYTISSTEEAVGVALHIYNAPKSIAEALLIHTNRTIAETLGITDTTVHLNSLGDADSLTRFTREITTFLRKRLDQMPVEARELMKKHPLDAILYLADTKHDLVYKSPNPLEYLSDQSRKHFRDIVEYLDMTDATYEIDSLLLRDHEHYSDTLFAIRPSEEIEAETNTITIEGGRIDELIHRKTKKKIAGVSSTILLHNPKTVLQRPPKAKALAPTVFAIQLGFGPKVRTLELINSLRAQDIPLMHDITNDSLSAQLREAETRNFPYVLIMGQKEYVEGTVILRDMEARKQEAIPIDQAIKRIKKLVG